MDVLPTPPPSATSPDEGDNRLLSPPHADDEDGDEDLLGDEGEGDSMDYDDDDGT